MLDWGAQDKARELSMLCLSLLSFPFAWFPWHLWVEMAIYWTQEGGQLFLHPLHAVILLE